jgi:heme/copper-type cytochrome/quinol oxidase subunit 2
MKEELSNIIEKLSNRFGITSESMWELLLKQAKLDAIISTIIFVIMIVCGGILYKLHKYFMKRNNDGNIHYEADGGGFAAIMVVLTIVWIVFLVIYTIAFISNITIFFNSEYWVLKEIDQILR